MERIIQIQTDPCHFIEWLSEQTKEMRRREFPATEGSYRLKWAPGARGLMIGRWRDLWRAPGYVPSSLRIQAVHVPKSGDETQGPGVDVIRIDLVPGEELAVTVQCTLSEVMDYAGELMRGIGQRWEHTRSQLVLPGFVEGLLTLFSDEERARWNAFIAEASSPAIRRSVQGRGGGHPGLSRDELVYRVAKAMDAEQIKKETPDMTWKEVVREIKWDRGSTRASKVKLLQDARYRLDRLKDDDPSGILPDAEILRERWRKEKKKTR